MGFKYFLIALFGVMQGYQIAAINQPRQPLTIDAVALNFLFNAILVAGIAVFWKR